jgi:hypothetical protein
MEATICRIVTHPSSYDGKLVRVRAYFAGSFEGSYLVDDKCGKGIWFTTSDGVRSLAVILVHNPYPDVPEPDFSLVKDKEYEKFTTFAYSIGVNMEPEFKVTATFAGRIDRCRGFKLNKSGFGNGFGQMGQSEFQFTLQSVSEVSVEEAKNPFAPVRSELPTHLPEEH